MYYVLCVCIRTSYMALGKSSTGPPLALEFMKVPIRILIALCRSSARASLPCTGREGQIRVLVALAHDGLIRQAMAIYSYELVASGGAVLLGSSVEVVTPKSQYTDALRLRCPAADAKIGRRKTKTHLIDSSCRIGSAQIDRGTSVRILQTLDARPRTRQGGMLYEYTDGDCVSRNASLEMARLRAGNSALVKHGHPNPTVDDASVRQQGYDEALLEKGLQAPQPRKQSQWVLATTTLMTYGH
ncbi:hypothetical protein LX36DRAFT_698503 [Colletotrichum falcatum]|nr:hypothetical protein LX36DRAFT_698503 [Colletotrichum falcatum]